MKGWIGVDLDGTLAKYGDWQGELHIGEPIPAMVERIKNWLRCGIEVRIFTARVNAAGRQDVPVEVGRSSIEDYTELLFGVRLKVTNEKDFGMIELWDDRAIRVRANTGEPCCDDHAR